MTDGHRDPASLDGALLCVVGARRSGTHWVQRLLATHPDVAAVPGETYLFARGIGPLLGQLQQHGSLASPMLGRVFAEPGVVRDHLRALAADLLLPYLEADPSGATVLCERTPEHVEHVEAIATLFPGTRFVHVVRDGNAVVRSLLDQPWGPTDAAAAAAEWRRSVEAGRAQGARTPGLVEVRHEELRRDPAGRMRALFSDLGLRADEDVVAAAVREASVVRNTRPGRTRPELDRRARREVRREAGHLLAELGYAVPSGRRDPGSPGPVPPVTVPDPTLVGTSIHHAQAAADLVLEALRGTRPAADLDGVLGPDVELVAVVDGRGGRWRGPEHLRDLLEVAAGVPALRTDQSWAAQHASRWQFTIVCRGDGPRPCTVVVGFDAQGVRDLGVYA